MFVHDTSKSELLTNQTRLFIPIVYTGESWRGSTERIHINLGPFWWNFPNSFLIHLNLQY